MTSPYRDLDRPPLSQPALQRALGRGPLWREVRVVASTGSTNADVAALAGRGAAEGLVLVAEEQSAGRGRLGRSWVSPPRAGLTFSVLLRPTVARDQWGWVPLLTGLAVAAAVRSTCELDAQIKWPNDVLVEERKLAGVLATVVEAEQPGAAVVVGVGVNVTTRSDELPEARATSLRLAGAAVADRDTVLRAVLRELAARYAQWRDDPAGLAADYRRLSATLGRLVSVTLPDGTAVRGVAADVDAAGRLVVDIAPAATEGSSRRTFAAGDVTHVR